MTSTLKNRFGHTVDKSTGPESHIELFLLRLKGGNLLVIYNRKLFPINLPLTHMFWDKKTTVEMPINTRIYLNPMLNDSLEFKLKTKFRFFGLLMFSTEVVSIYEFVLNRQ